MKMNDTHYHKHVSAIHKADGTVGLRTCFQCESGANVYEVTHDDGFLLMYRVDLGAWHIAPDSPIHSDIVRHFSLSS